MQCSTRREGMNGCCWWATAVSSYYPSTGCLGRAAQALAGQGITLSQAFLLINLYSEIITASFSPFLFLSPTPFFLVSLQVFKFFETGSLWPGWPKTSEIILYLPDSSHFWTILLCLSDLFPPFLVPSATMIYLVVVTILLVKGTLSLLKVPPRNKSNTRNSPYGR